MPANDAFRQLFMQIGFGLPTLLAYSICFFLGVLLKSRSPKASMIVILASLGLGTVFVCGAIARMAIGVYGRELGDQVMSAHYLLSLVQSTLNGAGLVALAAASFKVEPAPQPADVFEA